MAKSTAKSCPLCLSVNDPIDMLPVTMEHSTPPQSSPLYLCRLCVVQIMKATLQSDVVDPSEVFGDAQAGNQPDQRGDDHPASADAKDTFGSQNNPVPEAPVPDESEPKVPAGGGTADESDLEG